MDVMKRRKLNIMKYSLGAFVVFLFMMLTASVNVRAQATGSANYADLKGDYNFNFSTGTDLYCTIGGKSSVSGDVVIPQYIIVKYGDGVSGFKEGETRQYRVKSVGNFSGNTKITSITLPDGLEEISNSAFLNCTGLTGDLTIPDSVTSLGSQAFRGCKNMKGKLKIGSGITKIDNYTFFQCGFTGTLTIPSSVTEIANYAFQECKGFTGELVIPASVTSMGYDVFRQCTGFTGTLTLPSTATDRSGRTFYGCTGFTGLNIASGVKQIAFEEFYGCKGMTGSLVIPGTVTSIDYAAFWGCSGFTGTLSIPSGLTVLSGSAFRECSGFTGLNLPSTLTTINSSAFMNCTGMTGTLTLPSSLSTVQSGAFQNCGFTGDLLLPEGLQSISSDAFGCPNIDGKLTIPSTLQNALLDSVFSGMYKVRKVINNSDAQIYLIYNFIDKSDTGTFFVKSGTSEHLRIYTEAGWSKEEKQTIGKGTYFRNGIEKIPSTVVAAPKAKALKENGSAQALVSAGSADGGTLQYALGDKNSATQSFATSIPTAKEAGTYYVWYMVKGDEDHTDLAPESVAVTIAHVHKLLKTEAKDATEKATGNKAYWTCSSCGKYFSDASAANEVQEGWWIISKLPHTHKLVKTDAKAATEKAAGNKAYWTCSGCGKHFSDSEGKNEVEDGWWVLKKLAHKHKLVKTKAKAPNGSANGNTAYWTCSGCGKYFSDSKGTNQIKKNSWVILAKGKNFTDSKYSGKYKVTSSGSKNPTVRYIGCTNSKATSVTIPATVKYGALTYKVTEVSSGALSGKTKLKTIIVGSNVKKIGSKAFYNCKAATKITLGKNVTSIGEEAFAYCSSLTTLVLSEKTTTLGKKFAYKCNKKLKLTVKSKKMAKKTININAFTGMTNKTTVTIVVPKGMKSSYTKLFRSRGLGKKITVRQSKN